MNKNAIKTYAIWARNELISRVSQKAYEYGVEKENSIPFNEDSIRGVLLSSEEKNKRQQLIREIRNKGYDQVIEEVAYTWFNRFIALRYMEVNNYLPNKVRLFTNENNEFKPQIIEEALHIDIPGLDKNKVFELKEANNNEELYKELLLATCNDMSLYLPGMFKPISDYMTLLFPNNLLREESVLGRLISDIDEESWTDQVQIIGWLYQYYISEKHDNVIDPLHGKSLKKDEIPAATQLFTTDWVVKYMVDNSLGRYWIERNKDSKIKECLEYFVLNKESSNNHINDRIAPESITFLDPCMGSGHILVYAFDVFMQIYVSEGWTEREAAVSILKNNLFGLDIDERAYQLSYFALMMKARQYNRRILSENITPNVMAIEESNTFKRHLLNKFGKDLQPLATRLVDTFTDAKEYGSILNVEFTKDELDSLKRKLDEIYVMSSYGDLLSQSESDELVYQFTPLLKQAKIMSSKYECVVTNPPYLNNYSPNLKTFISTKYADYKGDLFSVFMIRNFSYLNANGYSGFLTPNVWMTIKSYEVLRDYILHHHDITTLIQMAHGAFNEVAVVDVCAFVLSNSHSGQKGIYFKLSDYKGDMEVQRKYVIDAINNPNCEYRYETFAHSLMQVPESPITAFAASEKMLGIFDRASLLKEQADPKQGIATSDNNKFLRQWYEVDKTKLFLNCESHYASEKSDKKWYPYNKGGIFRKWYGNNDFVINWQKDGYDLKRFKGAVLRNPDYYFKECISWSLISSYTIAFRYKPKGHLFDVAGMSCFKNDSSKIPLLYLLALNNSCLIGKIMLMLAPTINYQVGNIANIPVIYDKQKSPEICEIAKSNIDLARHDWDLYETSWDFLRNPLIKYNCAKIESSYGNFKKECETRFLQMSNNEYRLNCLFLEIYDLQDELKPNVVRRDISSTSIFDNQKDIEDDLKESYYVKTKTTVIKDLISYAVGCMFGRYSLDTEGLAYAGGEWDSSKYKTYIPDSDNILPITDDEYFEDDIVSRFINFIKIAYGEDTLEENLKFISDALGGKGSPREVIRNYFLNDFFKDHCSIYQKRPIYWQFDSGKKNGFKALMYIHRYTPDLIARMRTSYIHELQSKYNSQVSLLEGQIDSAASTSDRVKLEKQLKKIKDQADELRSYEEKIHHYADMMMPMDLDDGVKVNYAKFEELLTKIK